MPNWCLEVWGEYACFTRPEMKVERVSYDVMTPSAARAIFESIFWKPEIQWHVNKIEVLNPIRWMSVRRNEVGKKAAAPTAKQLSGEAGKPLGLFIEEERQQRAGLFLRDVRYRIHGHFDLKARPPAPVEPSGRLADETGAINLEAKYAAMFERRAKKGQCFHRPYLGCREFACDFKLVETGGEAVILIDETRDLGFMFYDWCFSDDGNEPQPMFFRAMLENGSVDTRFSKVGVRR
ncbi:MAG: type I-C CRISPR-associated protein Cas5 [Peptococcaceae bacterium]|nr:type I-C CRISPR-associated protein Cas5 [Peptococcaceae bacterium]